MVSSALPALWPDGKRVPPAPHFVYMLRLPNGGPIFYVGIAKKPHVRKSEHQYERSSAAYPDMFVDTPCGVLESDMVVVARFYSQEAAQRCESRLIRRMARHIGGLRNRQGNPHWHRAQKTSALQK